MYDWEYHVECDCCGASGPCDKQEAQAVLEWNRRAAAPAQAEPSDALSDEQIIQIITDAKVMCVHPHADTTKDIARAIERHLRILGQQGGGDAARLAAALTRLLEWRNPEGTIERSYIPGWLAAECRAAIQAQAGDSPTGGAA